MHYTKDLRAGRMEIRTSREEVPLTSLLDFASRINPKRRYLFVSRVLGKHIPTRPGIMRQVHEQLAEQLPTSERALFVGMAETAVGLGGGVADARARGTGCGNVFIQTTRYASTDPVLLEFREPHSHAAEHLLYAPRVELEADFFAAEQLVLVDDEITTGTTLVNLARELVEQLPRLRQVVFCSLVNWLAEERREACRAALRERGVELVFSSLIDGQFNFTPAPGAYVEALPFSGEPGPPRCAPRMDLGRRGIPMPLQFAADDFHLDGTLTRSRPVHVIGTGEFMLYPQWLALELERAGYQTAVQSTTRSPVFVGEAMVDVAQCTDEFGQGIPNYLYNTGLSAGVQTVVCYESPAQAAGHNLHRESRITALFSPTSPLDKAASG